MREIFKPVLILLAICVIISLCVSFVFNITEDRILAIEKQTNELLMEKVLKEAKPFTEITSEIVTLRESALTNITVNHVYQSEKGLVFNMNTKGYGGDVVVFVGITTGGNIENVRIGKNNETPSVGKKAEEKDFTKRFVDLPVNRKINNQVDTISGATITTKAVIEAVQEAVDYFVIYSAQEKGSEQ
ncbi:MAG: FMN-binding protein [Clostridiales bacterium]|nr:FMN-binding protein [Clostridiales bacterium]